MPTPLETVQEIYAAFGRGDVPAIFAHLDEQVQWEQWSDNSAQRAGVPWLAGGQGLPVVERFFGTLATMTLNDFQVLGFLAGGNQVAVEVIIDLTTADGRRFRDEELHLWTLNGNGKVVRMRHYADTAKHIAASGKAGV